MGHPDTSFDLSRLEQLLAEKCNGMLSSDGCQELEKIVSESAAARAIYWEHLSVHAGLRWMHSGKSECDRRLSEIDEETDAISNSPSSLPKAALLPTWTYLLSLAVAASLLLAVWLNGWGPLSGSLNDSAQASRVAKVKSVLGELTPLSSDSHWSFGTPGERNRKEFNSGDTLWLNQGAVELNLTNGILVQLEAPLIFEMVSMSRARVLRGRITVDVPEGENGFIVETAAAEVVDLGTTFSVDVADAGGTDVIVFQGKVDVNLSPQRLGNRVPGRSENRRLLTGEAVRISEDGRLSRIVNVRRTDFSESRTTPSIIKEVRDNVLTDQTIKYYEIVTGGMQEDVRTFVDRNYEWNGMDSQGIPSRLLGGDYVKTFNDDKVIKDLVITVAVECPAIIYLLVDDRHLQTNWLNEQFEDTGYNIGIDEGPHDILDDTRLIATGPGQSIDQVHSIWKCRAIVDDSITIGPRDPLSPNVNARGTKTALNMFGIVAVPIAPGEEQ